jgi:uncharacterized RDD family membrane protein YckC
MSAAVQAMPEPGQNESVGVEFAGFWRRVGALLVDVCLLACVGAAIGAALGDWLVGIGQWGRLIGVIIAGAYLIPANSRLFGGQTFGKRLLSIRVQATTGELLSPGRSAMRFLVFAVPYFGNGLFLNLGDAPRWIAVVAGVVLGTILIVGVLGNVYLVVLNRPSRRVLHDLVAKSVVVRGASPGLPVQAPVAPMHLAAFATIVVVIVLGGFWLAQRAGSSVDLKALGRAQDAVASVPGVVGAGINVGTFTMNGKSSHVITIMARVVRWPADEGAAASAIVAAVVREYPPATAVDSVRVVFVRGFDIGVAMVSRKKALSKTPAEWRAGTTSAGGTSTPSAP